MNQTQSACYGMKIIQNIGHSSKISIEVRTVVVLCPCINRSAVYILRVSEKSPLNELVIKMA